MHLLLYALLLSAGPAGVAPPPTAAQAVATPYETTSELEKVDRTTVTEELEFKNDAYDRMTVEVRVAGKGPYRFLVDTGADRSAVSSAIVNSLGLQRGPEARLHSVSGVSGVRTARVPSIDFSLRSMRDFNAPILEARNMGADGILGVDTLRSQSVVFDFRKNSLAIVPSVRERPRRDEIVVEGKLRRGHLIVTSAKADKERVTAVLDTGAELSVGNEALRKKLMARGRLQSPEKVELTSVTGAKLIGDSYQIREFEFGGLKLENVVIVFANAQTFKALGLTGRPTVLLGMNAMRAFDRVAIDFARRKLRVVMPEESGLDSVRMASR